DVVQSGTEWSRQLRSWERESNNEEPVGSRPKSTTNSPNRPRLTILCAAFTSPVAVIVTENDYVSRQSPNSRRRKRTFKGPGRVQAGDRREVRAAILYHEPRRGCCPDISLRGVGADRAEASRALHLQSYEEKVFEQGELLGSGRRDGRPGAAADSATAPRSGADQRRSCRKRISDVPGSTQHRSVPEESSGRKVHA